MKILRVFGVFVPDSGRSSKMWDALVPAVACSLLTSLDGLADGAGEDASGDTLGDAAVDTLLGDGGGRDAGPACAPNPGLQSGSPWPMLGGCVTHVGRSAFVGPSSPRTKWTYAVDASVYGPAIIAKDGTIYVTSQDGRLYAIGP